MKYILGYKTALSTTLTQCKNINETDDYEEWCIVTAKNLKEAKQKYEKTFLKSQKNNFIL